MITFLEFCLFLFALYLVTQIFLPMILPENFEKNWLFKKKKPPLPGTLNEKIETLEHQSTEFKKTVNEVSEESEKNLKEATELHSKVNQIK